jgi:hypothetical protein
MTGISRHGYVPEAVSLFDAAESAQTVRFVSTWPFSMSSATVRYLRISLKNPLCRRPRFASAASVSGAKPDLTASRGEDWRWGGNELRQFPQILGGGR